MPDKILIVDDEVIAAESIRSMLGQLGYTITGAVNTAEAALAAIEHERPDLVLMDINLGDDQEGIVAAETIRARHGLPVVFATAHADDAARTRAKVTHPFGYVTRPFEAHDLRIAIEMGLHNHTLEQRLQQSEQALRESEHRQRAVLDAITDPAWLKDAEGRFLAVNRAWCNFFDKEAPDVVGKTDLEVVPAESAQRIRDRTMAMIATGEALHTEEEVSGGHQHRAWFDTYRAPLRNQDAGIVGIVGIARDITERKRAATEIRRLLDFSQGTLDSLSAHLCVLDESGRILTVNRAWREFAERNPPATAGVGVDANYLDVCAAATGDDGATAQEMIRGIGAVARGELSEFAQEYACHSPDQQRWFAARVTRFFESGQVRIVVSHLDITEQKRAGEALRVEQALFESLVKAIPDRIYFKDRQSRYVRANDRVAEFLGLRSAAEVIGKTDLDLFTERHAREAYEGEQRMMNTGEPLVAIDEQETRPDGRVTWVSSTKVPLRDADGQISGLVGISRDITERKRAEEELRRTTRWLLATQRISAVGGWTIDLHSGQAWASPETRRIYGLDDRELTLPFIRESPLPHYRPILERALDRLVGQGERYDLDIQITRRNDGAIVDIHTVAEYDPDENFVLGVVQDITANKRAEVALRASEEKFATVFRDAPVWISISDLADGTYIDVSEESFRRSGFSREEVIGRPAHEVPWLTARARVRLVREIQKHGRVVGLEVTYRTKDGGVLHGLLNGELTRIGGRVCLLTAATDITERKRVEAALQALSSRQEAILAAVPDMIMELDIREVYTWANPAGLAFFGADIVGRNAASYSAGEQPPCCFVKPLLDGRQDKFYVQWWQRRHDGEGRLVAWWCQALRDGDGNVVGALASGRDITEIRRAEEALRESEGKYRTLVERANEAISIAQDGAFVFVNQRMSDLLGVPAEALAGKSFIELVSPEDRELVMTNYRKRIAGEAVKDAYDFRVIGAGGKLHWIFLSAAAIQWKGRPATLSLLTDITERKQAEEAREALARALERKNRELENLVFATSHDLRSPLLNIQGFSQRIATACQDLAKFAVAETLSADDRAALSVIITQQMPKSLGFILTSVEKMDRLINGLLRLSRLGRAGLCPEPLDVNAMLREIVGAMAFAIEAAGAIVEIGAVPACHGDSGQINQIFTNLLDNALKYRDPARPLRVSITGREDGGRAIYCMADNGVGIAAEHLEKIWELFFRAHPDGPAGGDGLGLSLVHRIVERHGGEILVESTLGEGSRFFVTLPARHAGTANPLPFTLRAPSPLIE
jgi:PAS domain S-box-containing protein